MTVRDAALAVQPSRLQMQAGSLHHNTRIAHGHLAVGGSHQPSDADQQDDAADGRRRPAAVGAAEDDLSAKPADDHDGPDDDGDDSAHRKMVIWRGWGS